MHPSAATASSRRNTKRGPFDFAQDRRARALHIPEPPTLYGSTLDTNTQHSTPNNPSHVSHVPLCNVSFRLDSGQASRDPGG